MTKVDSHGISWRLAGAQDKLTLVLKSDTGTNERRCNQPKGQGALCIRRLELNWIVYIRL